MNPNKKPNPNNDRLRELVNATGLSQAVALKLFNKELGPAAYSLDAWKAFLVTHESTKYRNLKPELLAHAEKVFAKLQT